MNAQTAGRRRALPIDGRDWLFVASIPTPRQSLDEIITVVADGFHMPSELLRVSRRQDNEIVWPRQIAMYLAVHVALLGRNRIAKALGYDHKTVTHAVAVVEARRADPRVDQLIHLLTQRVRERRRGGKE